VDRIGSDATDPGKVRNGIGEVPSFTAKGALHAFSHPD
jgi:hypothetical protein